VKNCSSLCPIGLPYLTLSMGQAFNGRDYLMMNPRRQRLYSVILLGILPKIPILKTNGPTLTIDRTTGFPKMAERTHYGLIGNTAQLLYRYHLKPRERHETWFCTFMYAGIGFILYGLLMPLKARYKTIFMPQFDANGFLSAIEAFQPTSLHTPKHILQSLLADYANADFSCISSLRTGGAMIPISMRDEWVQRHGSQCEVVCGMTEYAPLLPSLVVIILYRGT
jgi:acyl-CoA synthetase (AMP-forming)/AMP-acid ligase II